MRGLMVILFLVAGCGGGQQVATTTPGDSTTSTKPSVAASLGPSLAASPAADVLEPRGPGVTLKSGDSTAVDLDGGRYRVGWLAEGCTTLTIEWAQMEGGGTTEVPAFIPIGEAYIELPAGPGFLNHASDCDVTIRFEAAP